MQGSLRSKLTFLLAAHQRATVAQLSRNSLGLFPYRYSCVSHPGREESTGYNFYFQVRNYTLSGLWQPLVSILHQKFPMPSTHLFKHLTKSGLRISLCALYHHKVPHVACILTCCSLTTGDFFFFFTVDCSVSLMSTASTSLSAGFRSYLFEGFYISSTVSILHFAYSCFSLELVICSVRLDLTCSFIS